MEAMESNREEVAELRKTLQRSRTDPGTQALLHLLRLEQETLNRCWMDMVGDDLLRAQGEAQAIRKTLRLILP